jgi:hypothetical protein
MTLWAFSKKAQLKLFQKASGSTKRKLWMALWRYF